MNIKNKYYVYLHRRNDTNEVFYIGKGHGKRCKNRSDRNKWWKAIADKYGFTYEIVESNMSEICAFDLETELIKFYKENGCNLCNLTNGGEGISGFNHTDEAKLKISEAHKGRVHSQQSRENMAAGQLGKTQSKDTVRKRVASRGNYKHSEETKLKISKAHKGRLHSDKSKSNMSAAQKGKTIPYAVKIKLGKTTYCSNGMVFLTTVIAGEWCRSHLGYKNVSISNIGSCCRGERKTAYGYSWSYENIYNGETSD